MGLTCHFRPLLERRLSARADRFFGPINPPKECEFLLLGYALKNELEEYADLSRRKATRGKIGIERIELARPFGQDLHEFTALQPGIQADRQALEYPMACNTGLYRGRWIVGRHSTAHSDVDRLTIF